MGKIGDLFVRLGLKKDDYSKGINEAKKESISFADTIKGMSGKVKVAFAAVVAATAGVVAAIKNLSAQNQALGDAWGRITAGMAASWDTFKTAVARTDFSNLLSDMREASRLARDLYDAQDALGEISTSYNISLARQLKTINELKIQLRDMNLSDAERVEAGNKLMSIYQKLETNPTRGLSRVSDASLDQIAGKMGYRLKGATDETLQAVRQQVEQFFIWLGTEAGESWSGAYAEAASDPAKLMATTIAAQNAGLSEATRAMLYNYQTRVGEKDRIKMEAAVTAYYQQQAKYSEETRLIQQQINSIKAKGIGESDKLPGGEIATDSIATERKQAERIAKQAAEYQLSERTQLKKHYEEEKALLEQFGIDTAMLTLKYHAADAEILRKEMEEDEAQLKEMIEEFAESMTVEIEPFRLDSNVQEFLDELTRLQEEAEDRAQRFREAITSGFSEGIQELTDQLAGLSEVNGGAVLQALLAPLADMAQQEGELLIMQGLGIEAIKSALTSLNGVAAIAAGTALVAAAAAVKSGLSKIAQSGGAAGVATTGAADVGTGLVGTVQDLELTVKIEGSLRGSDIVLAAERTQANWSR